MSAATNSIGTMSSEDIYGVGSLDTLPGVQGKTNPNDSTVTGSVSKDKTGITNIKKGNILGEPITAWISLFALLFLLKVLVESRHK